MAYSDGTRFYTRTPISPTTAAVTAKAPFNTRGCTAVTVSADNLAGAEEVSIFIYTNGGWEVMTDTAGAAVKLTATVPLKVLEGGPRYGVTKTSTVGACGVFIERQN